MKMLCTLWVLIICMGGVVARVPEKLAGTDLFPYEGVTIEVTRKEVGANGKVSVDPATRRPRQETVDVVLPLGALNLASGAEFFTVMAQQLYKYADLIEVVGEGGGPVARGGKRVHRFITDDVTKNLKKLDAINPIAILMRTLFNQVDGTTGLADFRVSKLAVHKDGDEATLADWAAIVAVVVVMHKVRVEKHKLEQQSGELNKLLPKDSNSIIKAYNAFEMEPNKPKLGELIVSAMQWGEASGFGADLVLRMLMGGVYALCGHDQKMIKHFYTQLLGKLEELKILSSESLSAVQERFAREWGATVHSAAAGAVAGGGAAGSAGGAGVVDESGGAAGAPGARNFPEPYTPEGTVGTPAYTAYKLLKSLDGNFTILAYGTARVGATTYADCFETTVRNIVRALIQRHKDLDAVMHPVYAAYFKAYGTDTHQATQAARDAWAERMNSLPGLLHVPPRPDADFTPEIEPSLMNLLVALNYMFQLNIAELDAFTDENRVTISSEGVDARAVLIESLLPKINDKLFKKLGETIAIEFDNYKDRFDKHIGLKIILPRDLIIKGYIHVSQHAEIQVPQGKKVLVEIPDDQANIFMPLEVAANNEFTALASSENVVLKSRQFASMVITKLSTKSALIESFISQIVASTPTQIINLIVTALLTMPDRSQMLRLLEMLVEKGYAVEIACGIFKKSLQEGVSSSTYWGCYNRNNLLTALVKNGKLIEEALIIASEKTKSADQYAQETGRNLFELLFTVDNHISPDSANNFAFEFAKSEDPTIKQGGLSLLARLVQRNCGLEQAFFAAKAGMESVDYFVKNSSFNLLALLIKKEYQLEQIIRYLENFILVDVSYYEKLNYRLKDVLLEKSKSIDDKSIAVRMLLLLFSSRIMMSPSDSEDAKKLLTDLLDEGQGFELVVSAASEEMENNYSWGLELYQKLFAKGQGFESAAAAAAKAVKSSNYSVQDAGLRLYEALVEKGQAFEAAAAAAADIILTSKRTSKPYESAESFLVLPAERLVALIIEKCIVSSDTKNKKLLFDLSKKFVEKELFNLAYEIAQKLYFLRDDFSKKLSLNVYNLLVRKHQKFAEAQGAARALISHSQQSVIEAVYDLYLALLEQGEAKAEAFEISINALKNESRVFRGYGKPLALSFIEKNEHIDVFAQIASEMINSSSSEKANDGLEIAAIILNNTKGDFLRTAVTVLSKGLNRLSFWDNPQQKFLRQMLSERGHI